jgi:hypothetical protein
MKISADSFLGNPLTQPGPKKTPSVHKLLFGAWPYLLAFSLSAAGAVFYFAPWGFLHDSLWSTWGDLIFFQAVAQLASDAGPFASYNGLSWPDGFSSWSYPQAGVMILVMFWIMGGIFELGSASTLTLTLCLIAGVNAATILYFLRGISAKLSLLPISIVLSLTFGLSPFVLSKMAHVNVSLFFLIPLIMGVFIRVRNQEFGRASVPLIFLASASAVSPLWWTTVGLVFLSFLAIFMALARLWVPAKTASLLFLAVLFGSVPPILLHLSAASSFTITRAAWDSNVYGGRLADFLVSSPFINANFSSVVALRSGASVELSQVGIVGAALGAWALVFFVVSVFKRKNFGQVASVLGMFAAASFLLFLSGGFGNLQAGIFLLAGSESPARVWARLIIVSSIVGAGLLVLFVEKKTTRAGLAVGAKNVSRTRILALTTTPLIVLMALALDVVTLRGVSPSGPVEFSKFPEWGAVQYLESASPPDCAVLQLPIESMPIPTSISQTEFWPETYYRGLVPYLMSSQLSWSFGDIGRKERDPYVEVISAELSAEALGAIKGAGFCYVLHDKELSRISLSTNLSLPGSSLGIFLGQPLFTSERFDVYAVN